MDLVYLQQCDYCTKPANTAKYHGLEPQRDTDTQYIQRHDKETKTGLKQNYTTTYLMISNTDTGSPRAAIWDSGSTHHIVASDSLMTNVHTPAVTRVRGIGNTMTKITKAGTVDGLTRVLHMPAAARDVISTGSFLDQYGGKLVFTADDLHLHLDGHRIRCAKRGEDGLYNTCVDLAGMAQLAQTTSSEAQTHLSIHAQVLREQIHMLHRTLGHIGPARMKQVLEQNNFTSLKPTHLKLLTTCDACQSGKIRKRPMKKKATRRATTFGHTVVSDTSSRQIIQTGRGKRYANIAVDEATRWCWVTLLRKLSHTFNEATTKLLCQHLKGQDRRIFRTDQGGEFQNKNTDDLLAKLFIRREAAGSDNQHQNGLAERTIGVLFAMVRTFLADSGLPLKFWGEALVCAAYLRNRLPTSANKNNMSPYEMRFKTKPDLRRLRPFGSYCTALRHSRDRGRNKGRPDRGQKGIMVGYGDPFGIKGWRIYLPNKNTVITSDNVMFTANMDESIRLRTRKWTGLTQNSPVTTLQPFLNAQHDQHEQEKQAENTSGPQLEAPDIPTNIPGGDENVQRAYNTRDTRVHGRQHTANVAPQAKQAPPHKHELPTRDTKVPTGWVSIPTDHKYLQRGLDGRPLAEIDDAAGDTIAERAKSRRANANFGTSALVPHQTSGAAHSGQAIQNCTKNPGRTGARTRHEHAAETIVAKTGEAKAEGVFTKVISANHGQSDHGDDTSAVANSDQLNDDENDENRCLTDEEYYQPDDSSAQHDVRNAHTRASRPSQPSINKRTDANAPARMNIALELSPDDTEQKHIPPTATTTPAGTSISSSAPRGPVTPSDADELIEGLRHGYIAAAYHINAEHPMATDVRTPGGYKAAMRDANAHLWTGAFEAEKKSLRDLNVYKTVHINDLPANTNIIKSKWVLKIKPNADGGIERFKVRLCAKGFSTTVRHRLLCHLLPRCKPCKH